MDTVSMRWTLVIWLIGTVLVTIISFGVALVVTFLWSSLLNSLIGVPSISYQQAYVATWILSEIYMLVRSRVTTEV